VVALSLDNQWYRKYTRALLLAKLPTTVVNQLFPAYPAANPTLMTASGGAAPLTSDPLSIGSAASDAQSPAASNDASRAAYAQLSPDVLARAASLHQLLGSIADALGSNDWVVDGTKTTTGAPLLANDPHLGISMPSIWYEVGLRGGGLDVIGFSFPGVPGVIIGHNEHIAWGVTNVGADDTDLYLEKLDPKVHPKEYEYNGQWLPLKTRKETIRVRGGSPVTMTVDETLHGPILNNVVSDLKGYVPVSLKWTALQPDYTFAGFFQLDFASDWQEFLTAVSHISISQNFVYADTQGNIGYRMSGVLPIRSAQNGYLPVDGSTPAYEWHGYVPQERMPTLFNPPTHVIATANNQIVPELSGLYVTSTWDQGYRARRIIDLLTQKKQLAPTDYERIQADTVNLPAAALVPSLIRAGKAAGGDAAEAARMLDGWNDEMAIDSAPAALFEVTAGMLMREVIEPVMGKKLYSVYQSNYSSSGLYSVLLDLVDTPAAPFFGITGASTGNATTLRDQALARALANAMAQLRSRLGSDPGKWTWGALHTAAFEHPLAAVSLLKPIFGVAPVPTSGDAVTVSIGGDGRFSADTPNYSQRTVSSMRQIIDLSNWDASLWVTTTGESGEPFSSHYSDLVPLWRDHRYEQMAYSADAEAKVTNDLLLLTP
jgi:penicillin amidase